MIFFTVFNGLHRALRVLLYYHLLSSFYGSPSMLFLLLSLMLCGWRHFKVGISFGSICEYCCKPYLPSYAFTHLCKLLWCYSLFFPCGFQYSNCLSFYFFFLSPGTKPTYCLSSFKIFYGAY